MHSNCSMTGDMHKKLTNYHRRRNREWTHTPQQQLLHSTSYDAVAYHATGNGFLPVHEEAFAQVATNPSKMVHFPFHGQQLQPCLAGPHR